MRCQGRVFWAGVRALVLALMACCLASSAVASEGPGSRDVRNGDGSEPAGTVTAVLIRPAWGCTPNQAWGTLNTDWSSFGSTPVIISTTSKLCDGSFTLRDLERSGADTLVFSASASDAQLTTGEVDAIATYASQGHMLLATGLTFGLGRHDNNALAPVFGLAEQAVWRESGDSGAPFSYLHATQRPGDSMLFRDVPNPYVSSDAARCQKPADSHWSANDLDGASFLGRSSDWTSAITIYHGAGYDAVYIANTPEYQSTTQDLQFLYNALVYPQTGLTRTVEPFVHLGTPVRRAVWRHEHG